MKKLILDRNNPILREVAKEVDLKGLETKSFGLILKKMRKALHAEEDGVAIAAPQVGESLRIFMVKDEILMMTKPQTEEEKTKVLDMVFINPEVIKASKRKKAMEEGCLSVRWLYGKVLRSEKILIRAYNEKGERFQAGASGLLAQIFQHEIDHLDGVLFIDKAKEIRDLPPPPKQTRSRKKAADNKEDTK